VHTVARICSAGHGGQILISDQAKGALKGSLPAGVRLKSLGRHSLPGFPKEEALFQVVGKGLKTDFLPLRTKA
jgi:class 3 adenylate cyclase